MFAIAIVLIVLVALLHVYFLVLEMFLWTKPLGLKVFRQSAEKAEQSKVLAANQGLYNRIPGGGPVVRRGNRFTRVRAVLPGLRGGRRPVRCSDGQQTHLFLSGVTGTAGDRRAASRVISAIATSECGRGTPPRPADREPTR